MIEFHAAQSLINSLPTGKRCEKIPLTQAIGRITASEYTAPNDMPIFNRSAMDGIALRAEDLATTRTFTVIDNVSAGSVYEGSAAQGHCVKIMTGAPVPDIFDTVIRKEFCSNFDTAMVTVDNDEPKGANIAYRGEDFRSGDLLLSAGIPIQEFTIGTLASIGMMYADVVALPKCAVFSTGDEVKEPYVPLTESSIRNINAYGIMAQLERARYPYSYGGIIADTREALQKAIAAEEHRSDVMIFSGGVSEGDKDYLPVLLKDMGYTILYHGMNIKPGKPQLLAQKGDTYVFGLPGNPVSTILSMRLFVLPALRRLAGHTDIFEPLKMGRWLKPPKALPDKYHFVPVQAYATLGYWEIEPFKTNGSGDIFANARANGYACVAPRFNGAESPFFLL